MKKATPASDELERLLGLCLELVEREGPSAVDELLARHPEASELVRERLRLLRRLGLVDARPEDAP